MKIAKKENNEFIIELIKHYAPNTNNLSGDLGLVEVILNGKGLITYGHMEDDPIGRAASFVSGMEYILDNYCDATKQVIIQTREDFEAW